MTAKRKNIVIRYLIAAISLAYIGMVVMSLFYARQTATVLSTRFDDEVNCVLISTCRMIEERDMVRLIDQISRDTTPLSDYASSLLLSMDRSDPATTMYGRTIGKPTGIYGLTSIQMAKAERKLDMNRALMLEVMARKFVAASKPITERVDTSYLRQSLAADLRASGINNQYSLALVCYESPRDVNYIQGEEFDLKSEDIYQQMIFRREVSNRPYYIVVCFHDKSAYVHRYMRLVLPILICMTILAILSLLTIIYLLQNQRLSEIQNAFIKNMTHELKTPVASISLASEMLADTSIKLPPESYAQKARTIHNEATRLTQIIERVLQTSLLEHDSSHFKVDTIDLNTLITDSRDSFLLKVQQKCKGKIILHLDADRHVIYADRMHITNVIFNLMENAVKYSHPSRPLILEIATHNQDNDILIDVSDNGIGIEAKYLKRIFDRFYRVPAVGERHDVKGFGLGLSYVSEVICKNGGSITVKSEPNVGTRFTLTFRAFDS